MSTKKTAANTAQTTIDVEVRYAETDQMGVVHHSVYLVWFELARTRLCLDSGFHYASIEKDGYFLVVTGTESRLISGAHYGDTVRVSCWLEKMASRALAFAYEVTRDGRKLATGRTEHIWVDRATGRPCRTPELVLEPFRRMAGLAPDPS